MNVIPEWMPRRWRHCLFGAAAFAVVAIRVSGEPRSEMAAACVIGALALVMLFDTLRPVGKSVSGHGAAWGLLAVAVAAGFCPWAGNPLANRMLLLVFFTSAACRLFGVPTALRLLPANAVLLLIVPFRSCLMLYISYPLRRLSTLLSAGALHFCDPRIVWEGTTIMLPGVDIGITDACSGIAQLEAMFLIAYLIVRREKTPLLWRALHYLFLVPAIILANALRIILTAGLFRVVGERVFSDMIHAALGYFQVLLTIGIFLVAGFFLPEAERGGDK